MIVEISGRWCDYRLYFVWQEELSALHFSCGFDMRVPKPAARPPVSSCWRVVNEKLWLGHFDLSAGRHLAGLPPRDPAARRRRRASSEQIEDLVDIAVAECERFYPAFQLVIWGGKWPEEAMAAAMIDPIGEA